MTTVTTLVAALRINSGIFSIDRAIHARLARGTGDDRSEGIGLELIARLCEHLGWRLVFTTRQPQGTRVSLDLGRSRLA